MIHNNNILTVVTKHAMTYNYEITKQQLLLILMEFLMLFVHLDNL